jgi:hypothetical protein
VHADCDVTIAQGVMFPTQAVGAAPFHVQPSPCRARQSVCVSCEAHGCGVPLQDEEVDHVQPYSPLQAVCVAFAPQGVTAPTHWPFSNVHPWQ